MEPLKRGLPPSHPGAILKEIVLPELQQQGTSRAAFADLLGVGRRTLYDLLEEKGAVTPPMALRLSKVLGNSPEHWLNMQVAYDLAKARVAMEGVLASLKPLKVA